MIKERYRVGIKVRIYFSGFADNALHLQLYSVLLLGILISNPAPDAFLEHGYQRLWDSTLPITAKKKKEKFIALFISVAMSLSDRH